MEQILKIAAFVLDSFIQIWPYLLITIPIAVAVKLSGAAKYISKALSKKPMLSIFLATLIGAVSPFCSCGVIPVIASLLIGGVPLGPVMSFWIASPSMDPEIFFLSTATIGWKLSVWRLAATFVISLLSGYLTQMAFQHGLLGDKILMENYNPMVKKSLKDIAVEFAKQFKNVLTINRANAEAQVQLLQIANSKNNSHIACCVSVDENIDMQKSTALNKRECCSKTCESSDVSFSKQLINETWKASMMVAKFMTLAFLVNALIRLYVPHDLLSGLLDGDGTFTVLIAALTGVPFYTSNITALPLISGLLASGMNQGAALAFLIAGPVTTLPAMLAVWGIVQKKVFVLYVSFAFSGAILFGLLINFFG